MRGPESRSGAGGTPTGAVRDPVSIGTTRSYWFSRTRITSRRMRFVAVSGADGPQHADAGCAAPTVAATGAA